MARSVRTIATSMDGSAAARPASAAAPAAIDADVPGLPVGEIAMAQIMGFAAHAASQMGGSEGGIQPLGARSRLASRRRTSCRVELTYLFLVLGEMQAPR
jgi:hypothetical protein